MMIDLYEKYGDWPEAFNSAGLGVDRVSTITHASEGYNDGDSWICAGTLVGGEYFFLTAWCDYTGWGCQDGGEHFIKDTREELERFCMSDRERERLGITLSPVVGESPIVFSEEDDATTKPPNCS